MQLGMIHDQEEQLGADECMTVNRDERIVLQRQHFQLPHETEVIVTQL